MAAELTGLEIANASLLDEATAAAEAMSLCFSVTKDRNLFLVSDLCHPQTIDVLRTRAKPFGIGLVIGDHRDFKLTPHVAGVLVQYPGTDGVIHDFEPLAKAAHAAGALLGVCLDASYEGQAPMHLEALCRHTAPPIALPLARDAGGMWRSDWAPLLPALLDTHVDPAQRAAMFHSSLAHAVCAQALAVRGDSGVARVGLSGGVFQNRTLTEQARDLLAAAGFEVLIPQRLPINDAAISFGQLIETIGAQTIQ